MRKIYGNVLRRELRIKLHNLQRNLPFQDYIKDCKISMDFKHPVQDCKRIAGPSQKLHERKASRFTGCYPNVGKTFCSFGFICVKSDAIAQSICRKTFKIHRKSVKTAKLFSHVTFIINCISKWR